MTLHCPDNAQTRGLLNAQTLSRLKPGAIIVNTVRGDLLDDLDALRTGHLAAAAIATLAEEPARDHSLLAAWRNREDWLAGCLVVTPHNAFYSDHAAIEMRHNTAMTVKILLERKHLRNRVEA